MVGFRHKQMDNLISIGSIFLMLQNMQGRLHGRKQVIAARRRNQVCAPRKTGSPKIEAHRLGLRIDQD